MKSYIFIPYFGNFPNYFQLYLDSLAKNKEILTVFFLTDIDMSQYNVPSNAIKIEMSFDNIRERLSKFLLKEYNRNIESRLLLSRTVKFCDIKIIYPILFDDIMTQYKITEDDFVGWGDCDLIYGNLANFIKYEEDFHIIGGYHGHFTVIKNIESFKNLYKQIPKYDELILDLKHYATDEIAYREPLANYLKENNYKMNYINATFCDIVPPCYYDKFRKNHNEYTKNFFDVYNPKKNINYLYYSKEDSQLLLYYDDKSAREISYCHLQKRTMNMSELQPTSILENKEGYYIGENKFFLELESSVIPKKIYTTWHSKELPEKMQENINKLKKDNPEFDICIYDENDCYKFIEDNFPKEVLLAYNKLIPHSYKSDLWRFCILYINGGIYLDIKNKCINNFKFSSFVDKEYFVNDGNFKHTDEITYQSIYTGLIIAKKNNEILLKTICSIVNNVSKEIYGPNPWYPTGPCIFGYAYTKCNGDKNYPLVLHHHGPKSEESIKYNNIKVLVHYPEYRQEQKSVYYQDLWNQKKIYDLNTVIDLSNIDTEWPTELYNAFKNIILDDPTQQDSPQPDTPRDPSTKIRIHLPAIPYTITRDEFSHDAFTGKVKRFSPMMQSVGFEVYHYGIETSESGADKEIQLMTKAEWYELCIDTVMFLDDNLTRPEAKNILDDPKYLINTLSNWNSPVFKEFNKRFRTKLIENYRDVKTDIVCLPLSRSHEDAVVDLNYCIVEFGIGYSNSYREFRIFESYNWMSRTLGVENIQPSNYWFVIPHSFSTTEFKFNPTPNKLTVGYMGRVIDLKGCNIVLEVARRFPNVEFILCGQGDPTDYLKVSNIKYKLPIHGSERSDYLGSFDAVICPSKFLEPFNCVAVEAQLCGTPVICSDNGGMVETVEQFKSGLRCHTLADYCYGIQMAIDGKFDRQYIRDRAVRKYDMYNVAKQYKYVFNTVLDLYDSEKNGWYSPDSYVENLNDSLI